MSSELAALDELKGRLTSISIQYLDTGVRIRPAIECIDRMMQAKIKAPLTMLQVEELAEEISDLKGYFVWLQGEYPEVKKDTTPVIEVINWLLSIEENQEQITKH